MLRASSYLPRESRYFGDSGSNKSSPATTKEGAAQISRKIRQELYVNDGLVIPISFGMINHASPVNKSVCFQNKQNIFEFL